MDFNGTWEVYADENQQQFLKAVGVPEMVAKMAEGMKSLVEIRQKGADFTIQVKTVRTLVNSFSLGKEAEVTGLDGRNAKCVVREENGKLIAQSDKFTSVREIQGDDMVETVTAGSVSWVRRARRV